jgi:hypothetical protein
MLQTEDTTTLENLAGCDDAMSHLGHKLQY